VRFISKSVFRSAALGLGLTLTASLALASQGIFTLPVEAHVGNVTLSPGEYRIITPLSNSGTSVVYFYGNGKLKATLPMTAGSEPESGHAYLELVNAGGEYFVSRYNAPVAGRAFTFEIPKKYRHAAATDVRVTSLPGAPEGQ
jgi:hypothetical protein